MSKRVAIFILLSVAVTARAQLDVALLRPVGYHPSQIAYYNAPYFANALFHGGEWLSFTGSEHGTRIDFNTPQFENGYPKFLQAGQKLRAIVFGLNIENPYRPPGWPSRATLARGRIVVTWKGNADVRLAGCGFAGGGAESGSIADGRHARDVRLAHASLDRDIRARAERSGSRSAPAFPGWPRPWPTTSISAPR